MSKLIALFVSLCALTALGETPDPKTLPALPFKEEKAGNFSGTLLTVDEAFTARNEHAPPNAPFSLVVPKDREIYFLAGGKKSGSPELARFTTGTVEKRAVEVLRFASMTVPLLTDKADRLKLCAYLLTTGAFKIATEGYGDAQFLEAYSTRAGTNDAVCVHGHMTKPGTGDHYAVKLVAIPHPTTAGGVIASLIAHTDLSEIKKPGDLSSKGLGLAIIHSLKFVDPGKAAAKP